MKQDRASGDRKKRKLEPTTHGKGEGSNEDVLQFEIQNLLQRHSITNVPPKSIEQDDDRATNEPDEKPEKFSEIELEIEELSSTGDGLALSPKKDYVYLVPFSVPGDRVLGKVVELPGFNIFARADLIKIIRPSPKRNDAGIVCKYFAQCSGCQLQMLSYEDQLEHKKRIVEKAYRGFSGLAPNLIPQIGETHESPLRYDYRTKLTPHFDGPRGQKATRRFTEVPPIGFTRKGRKHVMDIENCPIATPIVREGFIRERGRVAATFKDYKNGATLLIRESTERTPKTDSAPYATKGDTEHLSTTNTSPAITTNPTTNLPQIRKEFPTYIETKTYTTTGTSPSVEYVDDWKFTNKAGSFFQNNNSILSAFTAYVRGHVLPPAPELGQPAVKYLLDAYCGSGLFAITLSSLFKSTLGVDCDPQAIHAARANAEANNVNNIGFIEADAAALFMGVPFPPAETVVIIDPPRKGCSEDFLKQLLAFGPERIVYVSCNVHSQAIDVGVLVRGDQKVRYEIESLRGFDFFPQTGHVEGVAFLNRVNGPIKT